MRLICGILRLDGGHASEAPLTAMAAAMTAPGLTPALYQRLDGPLGLAVINFGTVAQPCLERADWLIAGDLRLDGWDRADGDAPEVTLLDTLSRHGADFPDHLHGDFAAALWDRRAQRLWLGRDFMGIRPLVWTFRPGEWFAFASLPKALHQTGLASRELDLAAQGARLCNGYFRGPDTGFVDIAYLEAGHSLSIVPGQTGRPTPHRAYRPDMAQVGRWRGDAKTAAATLRALLTQAVADRLPHSGPVATHLSGGLDSSAITVLAAREARLRDQRICALSMTTPEAMGPEAFDERPMIAAILAQEPDLHPVCVCDPLPMPGAEEDPDWPGVRLDSYDHQMLAAAAAIGAGRVLSGVGGDEGATYNGTAIYARLLREGSFCTLVRELPLRARRDRVSLPAAIRDRLFLPHLPFALRRRLRSRPYVRDPDRGTTRFFAPAWRAAIHARRIGAALPTNSPRDRVRAFADHYLPPRCTTYAIMAARHGIAVSFPMLDRRVVDFMLTLPTKMLVGDGYVRQPFREAMRGILPDRVRLESRKVGLFDDIFSRYSAHKAAFLDAIEPLRKSPVATLFDLDAVAEAMALLPETDDRAEGKGVDRLGKTVSIWEPLIAIQCLVAATRMARWLDGTKPE
jgi:asparagine synthase (glutamine-hydrolysing)